MYFQAKLFRIYLVAVLILLAGYAIKATATPILAHLNAVITKTLAGQ